MANLLLCLFFLSTFGFFNLLGINSNVAFTQLFNLFIGAVAFFVVRKIGRIFFRMNSMVFYLAILISLIITFFIGVEVKGSKRWINLFFFNFQASEFFKTFFILFLADFFSSKDKYASEITAFLKSLLYLLIPAFIIFKQPDLGNAMILIFVCLTMLLFSGVPKKYLLYLLFFVLISFPVGWQTLKNYQKERLVSFISPHIDTRGNAYNMIQAVITIGSGKFLGRGLGLGTQSRLYFLPENRTDFAFASLIEQFGFIGGLIVIVLYLIISVVLLKKIIKYYFKKDEDSRFYLLLTIGVFSYFVYQVFINIGMNLGLLPIVGVALPFISYGGSSIVSLMIGFALLP